MRVPFSGMALEDMFLYFFDFSHTSVLIICTINQYPNKERRRPGRAAVVNAENSTCGSNMQMKDETNDT